MPVGRDNKKKPRSTYGARDKKVLSRLHYSYGAVRRRILCPRKSEIHSAKFIARSSVVSIFKWPVIGKKLNNFTVTVTVWFWTVPINSECACSAFSKWRDGGYFLFFLYGSDRFTQRLKRTERVPFHSTIIF